MHISSGRIVSIFLFLACHRQSRKKCLETVLLQSRGSKLDETRHEGIFAL